MRHKIIGIIVSILLMTTAIPTVESLENTRINSIVSRTVMKSTGVIWNEMQKLLSSCRVCTDYFGYSVSLSGDTVLIGAIYDGDNGVHSGSVHVFTRSGTTWILQTKLLASDGAAENQFGYSVSLDGDTALIGAPFDDENGNFSGSVYVFTRTGNTWIQQVKLLASDGAADDHFGSSVAISDNTALIGAPLDDTSRGSAYIFTRTGTTWTQQAKLISTDGVLYDKFGNSVSLDGDTALIGAPFDDDNGDRSGSVYMFTRTGATWTQQAKLLAIDGAEDDNFGYSVSVSGNTALIGTVYDDNNGVDSGSAYVFAQTSNTWIQQAKLLASDGAAGDMFGYSVSLSDDTAIIGAPVDDSSQGSAYVFTRTDTTWTQQQKLLASDGAANTGFSYTISLDGDTALIGAPLDDSSKGSAYVFTKTSLTFSITGGFKINLKITNNGTTAAKDVPWQIHVEGGILGRINKTINGAIYIPTGGSATVVIEIFGFGPISITAKVANEEKTATGTQLIFYSMVK